MGLIADRFGKEGFSRSEIFGLLSLKSVRKLLRQSAINAMLRLQYRSDLRLHPDAARAAGNKGLKFLRWCQDLAFKSHQHGKALFILQPIARAFHHLCLDRCQNKAPAP